MIGTVVLRKNILPSGWFNSAWIELLGGKKIKDIENFLQRCGFPMLMEKLFREQTAAQSLEETELYRRFLALQSKVGGRTLDPASQEIQLRQNEDFWEAYVLSDEFAVRLDRNITLYHMPKSEPALCLVPWRYADSEKYLGDTWWYSDAEILHDFSHLDLLTFLERYKGY